MGGNFNPLDPVNMVAGGGKNQSPPPAPDYTGAALQQQKSQFVSQNTPYGSLTYKNDPHSPSGYGSTITLNPQAQSALDQQMRLSGQMGNLAESQLGNVQQQFAKPFDMNSVNAVSDKAYGALTSRLDPQWAARQEQFDSQMANQGIPVGSEAYTNARREFDQGRNDAYQQANLAAIQTMPQTYQLASSVREQPLNELNALRTGAQVQNPQFQTYGQSPLLQATGLQGQYGTDVYNQQMAQRNALTSGLFGLGGTLGAAALLA